VASQAITPANARATAKDARNRGRIKNLNRRRKPSGSPHRCIRRRAALARGLDRIRIDRTHFLGSINPVNPVWIIEQSRFTRLMGSPMAIPINHDLL